MNTDRSRDIQAYVASARERGTPDSQIIARLLEAGWGPEDLRPFFPDADIPTQAPPPAPEDTEQAQEPPQQPSPQASEALEVIIGTAWFTRVGMVAVLVAVAYILIYAYVNRIIGPETIIGAGFAAGIVVMALGETTWRRGFEIQSQALTGGGAAVLYLSIWAGQHLYGILNSALTFPAMTAVTVATAAQAIRHKSETVATLAWITGYAIPLLIRSGSGEPSVQDPAPLFVYLVVLSIGVFFVAQRHAWPAFTGLALMGAYSSGVYIFRLSTGDLGWTLTYLMIVTAGMLWVATTQKGRAGQNFGSVGAAAGYLVTGIVILGGGEGDWYVPYMYLLALSGVAMWLGHAQDWKSMRWLGAIGAFVGFLLLLPLVRRAGVEQYGDWMLLYAGVTAAGLLTVSSRRRQDAEPLALSAVIIAYVAVIALLWSSPGGSVSGAAMLGYLLALAAAVLGISTRFDWPTFAGVGMTVAFLATGLVRGGTGTPGFSEYPLMYLALFGAGALSVSAYRDARLPGTIAVIGVFAGLLFARVVGPAAPPLIVPTYLAITTLATLGVIVWRRWYELEWIPLIATWVLYLSWRFVIRYPEPAITHLAFTWVYLLAILAASWMRHSVQRARVSLSSSVYNCVNAAAFFGIAAYDTAPLDMVGLVAVGLSALYVVPGIFAVTRTRAPSPYAETLIGIGIFFATLSVPLLGKGYQITALWALEAAALLILGLYYTSYPLRHTGRVILLLPVLTAVYGIVGLTKTSYVPFINDHTLGFLCFIAALYICSWAYARFEDRLAESEYSDGRILAGLATGFLLWVASAEAWMYTGWTLSLGSAAQHFALSGVWVVFGAALLGLGMLQEIRITTYAGLGLFALTAGKILMIGPTFISPGYTPLIQAHTAPLIGMMAVLFAVGAWYLRRQKDEFERSMSTGMLTAATALLLWVASVETWFIVGRALQYPERVQQFALSGVWIIFAAAMLGLDVIYRVRALRFGGLGLLGVTVLKVLGGQPALSEQTYLPLINPQAAPLVTIAAILLAAGLWYRYSMDEDDPDRDLRIALPVAAGALALWAFSQEAWIFTSWYLQGPLADQIASLSAVWLIFAVILLGLGLSRDYAPVRWASLVLMAAVVLKILLYEPLVESTYFPVLNPHAGPLLIICALLYGTAIWLWMNLEEDDPEQALTGVLTAAATILLLWTMSYESWHYLAWETEAGRAGQLMALSTIWILFGATMLVAGLEKDRGAFRAIGLVALGITAGKVLLYDQLDEPLTEATYRLVANHFAFPLLLIVAMLFVASHWYRRHRENLGSDESAVASALPYIACALLWWVLTMESWNFVGWDLYAGRDSADARNYALSATWTAYGAILVAVGIIRRNAPLRWIGIGLLGITVVKVFFLDLAALDTIFKILALLGIGIVLIAIGFGYQYLIREQGDRPPGAPPGGSAMGEAIPPARADRKSQGSSD